MGDQESVGMEKTCATQLRNCKQLRNTLTRNTAYGLCRSYMPYVADALLHFADLDRLASESIVAPCFRSPHRRSVRSVTGCGNGWNCGFWQMKLILSLTLFMLFVVCCLFLLSSLLMLILDDAHDAAEGRTKITALG